MGGIWTKSFQNHLANKQAITRRQELSESSLGRAQLIQTKRDFEVLIQRGRLDRHRDGREGFSGPFETSSLPGGQEGVWSPSLA